MNRILAILFVTVATVLVAATSAGAQEKLLAHEAAPTSVSAYAGVTAWSHYHNGRYMLRIAMPDGRVIRPRVRSRSVPFDVDVGPATNGKPVLVYSRCRHEPTSETDSSPTTLLPAWQEGRGCQLFRYDVTRRVEHFLRGASSRAYSETLPSTWRGRLSFVRVPAGRPTAPRTIPQIISSTLNGERRHRFPRGTIGKLSGTVADGRGPTVGSLDLRGARVTYGWTFDGSECQDEPTSDHDDPTSQLYPSTQVIEASFTARRVLASTCTADSVFSPVWENANVLWIKRDQGGLMDTLQGGSTGGKVLGYQVISSASTTDGIAVVRTVPRTDAGFDIVKFGVS